VREYLDALTKVLADADADADADAEHGADRGTAAAVRRSAVLALSALVGALSMARAVDDPELSDQILGDAALALKELAERRKAD
jgi:hypothetical protein